MAKLVVIDVRGDAPKYSVYSGRKLMLSTKFSRVLDAEEVEMYRTRPFAFTGQQPKD